MQKTINRSRKNWSKKLDDALWAYRTAYKNPMGMSPYKMVYGKACHLPLEIENKAYWAIKELNYDFKLAGEKRLFDISSLDEWRTQAYENAKLFKEKVKRWNNKTIQKREFNVGDYVLLYNSRLRFFCGKTSLLMGRCLRYRGGLPFWCYKIIKLRRHESEGGKRSKN